LKVSSILEAQVVVVVVVLVCLTLMVLLGRRRTSLLPRDGWTGDPLQGQHKNQSSGQRRHDDDDDDGDDDDDDDNINKRASDARWSHLSRLTL
jgi:phosphopantothenoylcysteine synthetase/decarboxylase